MLLRRQRKEPVRERKTEIPDPHTASGASDSPHSWTEHFQHHMSRVVSVLQDESKCPKEKYRVCCQDGCTDVEVNKEAQLSVL